MFRLGKTSVEAGPRKQKRKHGLAYYAVGAFVLAVEIMLGINAAFLVDQSLTIVAHNMLAGISWLAWLEVIAPLCISLIVGACFVAGGMWTFAGFLDNLDDARAYAKQYTRWDWPQLLVVLMILAIIGLDYTTLLFRAAYFAEKGATALFAFFCILIILPFVLGCFMHVLEHTPRTRRMVKAERDVEQLDADAYDEVLRTMPSELRSRYLDGDTAALQEWYDERETQRDEGRQREREAMAERDKQAEERRTDAERKQRNAQTPVSQREPRPFSHGVPTTPGTRNAS